MAKARYWKIDEDLVRHVAKIARLQLEEEEVSRLAKQLGDILQAFEKIDEVDIAEVRPSFHPLEIKNVLREDRARGWDWKPLQNTKHKKGNYFKGPRVV
jgi:aspartyl-tRNA(Asn)/glutamyl-tRNA(Gln) amidotransferase subunit C